MKFVWLIAIVLGILFGFSTAANFLSAFLVGAMVFLLITGVFMAISELVKLNLLKCIEWVLWAALWGWLLSI